MTGFGDRFAAALRHLEETRETGDIVPLFGADASISNPMVRYEEGGERAADRFWTAYRGSFDEIASRFHHIADADGASFLEWVSEGRLAGGEAFRYGGVSVLEHDGEHISAFRTYFDSAKLSA